MKSILNLCLSLPLVLLINCSGADKSDNNEPEKIKKVFTSWVKEFNESKNDQDYFKYLANDFKLIGCGYEPISNRDTIKAELKKFMTNMNIEIEDWQSQEIIVRDDIAIHRHSGFEAVSSTTDTTKNKFGYNYLDILKKDENGDWKIYLHVSTPKE